MTLPATKPRHSIADYLLREEAAATKHEFHDGEILAMSGGSPDHALVAANFIRALGNRLSGKPCRVYTSDLRVAVAASTRFVYPDATVVCGALQFHPDDPSRHSVTNPTVIVEVLSPSTEAYDRGEKFNHYRRLPSLREYVLISPYAHTLETFLRRPATPPGDDAWLFTATTGLDASAPLGSLDVALPLVEVYADVELIPPPPALDERA
jgi:Uma2 family endonuclease